MASEASPVTFRTGEGSPPDVPVPEPVGMQIYWNLSSVHTHVREAASVALVRELIGAQRDYEDRGLGQEEKAAEAAILGEVKPEEKELDNCAPAVQYALRRLIRGVASSRESARQGFALALASVLGALPCISGVAVVKMVKKHLEVTSSMKGQEARDALLGQLFAYAALIRSSRAPRESCPSREQELAKELTQQLLLLAKKKVFLRQPAIHVLVELGEKLQASGVEGSICAAPIFLESLKEAPDVISPDILFLVLKLHQKLPKDTFQSCSLVPDSGKLIDIFKEDQLLQLVPCLMESSSCHPRIHPVWDTLLEILFSETAPPKSSKKKKKRKSENLTNFETLLVTFWSTVVDGALLTSSHERKHLAMQLLLLFLPRLPSPSYIQYILSKNIIQCILGARASKENLLYKSAQSCIAEVCKWAAGDDECRIRTVIALQQGSQGRFDHLSRTQSVKSLLSGLSTVTGYQSIFQALSDIHNSGVSSSGDIILSSSSTSKKQKSSVETPEGGKGNNVTGDNGLGQQRWAVDQLRALCQQALVGLPTAVAIEELIVKFVPSLTPVQPFTQDEEESAATLQNTMVQVNTALLRVEAGEQKDRLQAMLSLLVQLLLESRLVPSVAVETASEITICCKEAFGDLVELEVESDAENEKPAFMDVLVDVLLSLLAQPSAPIRAAADQVFKSFCGDLTSSGLTDLLRIVKKNTRTLRHKPVVELDSQKNDDEDILDVEETDEEGEEGEEGEEEEEAEAGTDELEDGNESDEESAEVPGFSKNTVVASKGKQDDSRGQGDGNHSDESEASDLDDETMFRMDRHLANILKQRKQGVGNGTDDSKDAQTQLMHFKFRVLALLDIFLQKHSGSLLVLTLLPSLLHVFVNSCTSDGNSQVADRVSSILQNKLFKGKQYPKGPEVDQSGLKDLLRKALKLASRSTIKRVALMAQAACLWILKVIQGNLAQESDKDVEEMFSSALRDFFVQKKCKLSTSFFKECFIRNPWLGNSLLEVVLENCTTARTEYLRFEALALATTILGFKIGKSAKRSKQPSSDLSSELLAKFIKPHLPCLRALIFHLLKAAPSAKACHRIVALQFCLSVLELFKSIFPDEYLIEFVNSSDFVAALQAISAPPKSKLSNVLTKLRQLEKGKG